MVSINFLVTTKRNKSGNLENYFQRVGNFPSSRDAQDFVKNGLDGLDIKYKIIIYDLLLIGQQCNVQKMNKCNYLQETTSKDYVELP